MPLAQAVMTTGGVKDVGLELGAYGLIAGEGHGEFGGGICTIVASHEENWEITAGQGAVSP